jgi:hypothetical protein
MFSCVKWDAVISKVPCNTRGRIPRSVVALHACPAGIRKMPSGFMLEHLPFSHVETDLFRALLFLFLLPAEEKLMMR